MMISERIQALVHKIDVEASAGWLNYLVLLLLVPAVAVWYDTHCYHNFNSPEAMDAAQVAHNLSEGKGFTTDLIRPFSVYLLQEHNHAPGVSPFAGTNSVDVAQLSGHHPDLANAPVYPLLLAGLFKVVSPHWEIEYHKSFWADSGRFLRYKPEFVIDIFNQLLFLAAVALTFFLAKRLFDSPTAWISAALMLSTDELWKYSISGLPTIFLIVVFLALTWCLTYFDSLAEDVKTGQRRRFAIAMAAGCLAGLGMLTRYSFGGVILPLLGFFAVFGGIRRFGYAVAAFLAFAVTVAPWIIRNYWISGTPFGTAGFAVMENSEIFSSSRLMQSLHPQMYGPYRQVAHLIMLKLAGNLPGLLRDEVPRIGGGWAGILFLAGLLLNLRNLTARRLRYFTVWCICLFVVLAATGVTSFTTMSTGGLNAENLLPVLAPLAIMFGVAFFMTLLEQMDLIIPSLRYAAIFLMILLLRLQFVLTLLPPKTSPSAYPPYYPPDVQKLSDWLKPDELAMSDIPWAVAWYGDRQCMWTTINCDYEFVSLNDFIKPVNALYLSLNTLDAKYKTECMQGEAGNWSNFAFRFDVYRVLPEHFPLQQFPLQSFASGFVLCDHIRWPTE